MLEPEILSEEGYRRVGEDGEDFGAHGFRRQRIDLEKEL